MTKIKQDHQLFRLTQTAAIVTLMLSGAASTNVVAQSLDTSGTHNNTATWTDLELGTTSSNGDVILADSNSNQTFTINQNTFSFIGAGAFLTAAGQDGSITLGSLTGTNNTLDINLDNSSLQLGGNASHGQSLGTTGAQGGNGTITIHQGNTLNIQSTTGQALTLGGNGGNGGGAGSSGGNGSINGDGDILLNGNYSTVSIGGQGGRGGDGALGSSGGAGSTTNAGTAGGNASAAGAGMQGGEGSLTISGGTASITQLNIGGQGGIGGNGGAGGTGGRGSDGARGGDATSSSSGSTGANGLPGGAGGTGGAGGAGGQGADGDITITGGTFTVGSIQLGAAGGTGGIGGSGGQGGDGGNGGGRGNNYYDGWGTLQNSGGAGGNGATGGNGGLGGAAGSGGDGGSGSLTVSGAGTIVSVTGQFNIGGAGGSAGNGGSATGGKGGNANGAYGTNGSTGQGGGNGGASTGTVGGDGGEAGAGDLTVKNNAIMNAVDINVGGNGGTTAAPGTSINGNNGSATGSITGGTGGTATAAASGVSKVGGTGTILVDDHSELNASGYISIGGHGETGGTNGLGGNASMVVSNYSKSSADNVYVGGNKNTALGGTGSLDVIDNSEMTLTGKLTIGGINSYDANTDRVTIDNKSALTTGTGIFVGNDTGGANRKAQLDLGGNSIITSDITLNGQLVTGNLSNNATFNVTSGDHNRVVGDLTINTGYANILGGNLDIATNNITLQSASVGEKALLTVNNGHWVTAKELHMTGTQGGQASVLNNSTLIVEKFDATTLTTPSTNTTTDAFFHIDNTNSVAIIGTDGLSWDASQGVLNHQAELLSWHQHEIEVAGRNPASYVNGTLAFKGMLDSSNNAVSLDFSKIGFGVGTAAPVAPGSDGAFGDKSLTIINAPYYIYNNTFYNHNVAEKSAIIVDSGINGNPFNTGTGTDDATLLVVVDDNTKVGDSLYVLQNSAGNFDFSSGQQGWLNAQNAFSTSRLLSVKVTQENDKLLATFGKTDTLSVLPGLSPEVGNLLEESMVQVGHTIGLPNVNGTPISSGIHFVSRASDFLYVADPAQAANILEGSVRLAAIGGTQAATMRANIASADVIHSRATKFDPSIFLKPQALSFNPDYSASNATEANSSPIESGWGLWIMPVYQNTKAKDLEIGNTFKVGYDDKFAGFVAGLDYTTENLMRFGFSIDGGKGDVQSTRFVQPTKNDYDYWGISAYTGWAYGNLTLSGDIGFTKTSNSIKQRLPASMLMDDLTADVDNSAWAVGIKAEYQFNLPSVTITPYAGARFMRLTTDAYSVWTDPSYSPGSSGRVFDVKEANQDLVRFPVGVMFSKEFQTSGAYTITPQLDLGIIYTTGDRDVNSETSIPGVNAMARVTTPVVDSMTYVGKLGIGIQKKNFTFNINYSHHNASHQKSNAISGTLRYDF